MIIFLNQQHLSDLFSYSIDKAVRERREYEEKELKRKRKKEHEKFLKQQKEYEIWKKVSEEEMKNPDEFRILPYGWSPFGFFI